MIMSWSFLVVAAALVCTVCAQSTSNEQLSVADLRTTTITSTSIVLAWSRPELIVGPNFHYTYQIFDPNGKLPDRTLRLPFSTSSARITFTVNGLQPATTYVINIATNNGNDARKSLIQVKTRDDVPSAPRDVSVVNCIVVWKSPTESNGEILGYEVKLGSLTITKIASENYHIISNFQSSVSVQVRAQTSAGFGEYSEAVTLESANCPSGCQPPTPQPLCPSLTNPANGRATVTRRSVGGRATYTCNSGYTLSGSSSRTCQSNGEWSGSTPTCNTIPQIEFCLGAKTYPNNSEVSITNIGDSVAGGDALLCKTDNTNCCRNPDGEFYYPDGSPVGFSSTNSIYRNRGEGVVRLNRRNGATSPLGRYKCIIPDATGTTRSVYINIVAGETPPPPLVTCPSLSPPTNGRVSANVGGRATYTCNTGYTLSGSSIRICQSNGVWSGSAPTCVAVQCPSITNPANGRVVIASRSVGGRATYICNSGSTLIGSSTRTCQPTRQWSGSAPTCQVVQCSSLTNPISGRVTVTRRSVGGRAIYTCDTGSALSGSSSRTCQSNGVWSGAAPTCVAIQCPSLTSPANGRVSVNRRSIGGRATYTCNSGYTLSGSSIRACLSSGEWSGSIPTCVAVQCPSLNNPANGRVTVSSRSVGGRATCTCNSGYTLSGSSSRTCQSNGVWSGSAPICQAGRAQCPQLPVIANGRVIVFSRSVGGVAGYTCNIGYTLSGSAARICQPNGEWSGSTPTCGNGEIVPQCPPLPNPPHGSVSVGSRSVGGRATYTCNSGSTLIGSASRTCQADGTWSGSAPTCKINSRIEFTLGDANYPNNSIIPITIIGDSATGGDALLCVTDYPNCCSNPYGELYYPDGSAVGFSETNSIYRNRGEGVVRLNRRNDATSPLGRYRCDIPDVTGTIRSVYIYIIFGVFCPSLAPPANGVVGATTRYLDATVSYSCDPGYILIGSPNRTCLSNRTWSGSAPTCSPIICPVLSDPINGRVTAPRKTFGGRATYTCDIGYTLSGFPSRICEVIGQWSGSAPTCRRVITVQPSIGFKLGTVSYNNGAEIKITDIGEGEDALLCVTDSTNCCNAQTTVAGEFYYPDGSLVGVRASGASLYRNRGDKLIRLNRRNGATSPLGRYRCDIPDSRGTTRSVFVNIAAGGAPSITAPPPSVTTVPPTPVTCPPLPPPSNGRVSGSTSVGSVASYSCFSGSTLIGPSTRICQSNGVWSGFAPVCRAAQCPTLPAPTNGRVTLVSRSYNGRATYTCNSGYALSGSSSRTCLFNGVWSGSAPTCQAVQCLSLTNPANGEVTVTRRSVGSRTTYTCNSGYTLSGFSSRTCLFNGAWSGSAPTCQASTVWFTLRGLRYLNNSRVSLNSIGEDDEALLFPTEYENCCQTQKIGECYYPDGTKVGIRASADQIYRNRRSQLIRLNRKPSAGAGGRSAPTGLYCCTVPNKEGILQRVCFDCIG